MTKKRNHTLLIDHQKHFINDNRDNLTAIQMAEKLNVRIETVRKYIKWKGLKVVRKRTNPNVRERVSEAVNGFFNVDAYKGEYSWII